MRRCQVVWPLVVAVAGCKFGGSPVPVPEPDASPPDATISTLDADSESQLAETAVSVDGAADSAGDKPELPDTPDVAPVADGLDVDGAKAGEGDTAATDLSFVWPPPKGPKDFCASTGPDMPSAGQPCAKEGLYRCTNADAFTIQVNNTSVPKLDYACVRPHRLRCQKGGAGLTWVSEDCPWPPAACLGWQAAPTCQENPRGAHCCATIQRLNAGQGPFKPTELPLCSSVTAGTTWCGFDMTEEGQTHMLTCNFLDAAAGDLASAKGIQLLSELPQCIAFCKDCVYQVGHKECPIINATECNLGTPELPDKQEKFPICTTKIPNKGPSCVTNCDEFKYTSYWKPK